MMKKTWVIGKVPISKGKLTFKSNTFLVGIYSFKFVTANTKFLRSKIGEILLSNYWLLLLFMVLTCRNWVRYWVLFQFFYRDFYRDVRSLDNTISNYDVEENMGGGETRPSKGNLPFETWAVGKHDHTRGNVLLKHGRWGKYGHHRGNFCLNQKPFQ